MSLSELFQKAVHELRARKIPFAVAGGFAADLYRHEPRLTMDVDFVILVEKNALDKATTVLEAIDLVPGILRRADMDGGPLFAIKRKKTKPCMVVGRRAGETTGEGVDIILPEIPWVQEAVKRAQENPVDFGFGEVPVLTVEDVVIAKLYALQSTPIRAKDLDDLQSIFAAAPELNVPYIAGRVSKLNLVVPKNAKPFLPSPISAILRDAARMGRGAKGR